MPLITQVQCGSDKIALKTIEGPYIRHLVDILNNDRTLAVTLSSNNDPITPDQLVEHNNKWAERTNSKMFAIVLNNEAIGSISLSHIDIENRTAQIGYWLSSSHWNKGYTSTAFKQILDMACDLGIMTVSCKLDETNTASKAIWARHGAVFTYEECKITAHLKILK